MLKHYNKSGQYGNIFLSALLLFFLALFSACSSSASSSETEYFYSDEEDNKYSHTLIFYNENDNARYKVYLDNGKIVKIYRNEKLVPEEDISKYGGMIFDELDRLRKDKDDLAEQIKIFKFDTKKSKEELKKLKERMRDEHSRFFEFEFDKEKFKEEMDRLKEELKGIDSQKIRIKFDRKTFRENIRELTENLRRFHIPPKKFKIELDMHDLDRNMKELGEEIKKLHFEFDPIEIELPDLKENLDEIKIELNSVKKELKGVKKEIKKLNDFLDDVRVELVNDNIIEDDEDDFDFELTPDVLRVNGEEVSSELLPKYQELYKKHFGKEIEKDMKIKIQR
jgi:predicted  nucleic acid-binding Zn-ribbon protein